MEAIQLRSNLFTRLFLVLTKFVLVCAMIFSIVALFFLGTGVMKKSNSTWTLVTKEESMK